MLQTDPAIQRMLARADALQLTAHRDFERAKEAGDEEAQVAALLIISEAQDIKTQVLLGTCPITIIKGE